MAKKYLDNTGDWRDGDDTILPGGCLSLVAAVIENARLAALRRDRDAIAFFAGDRFAHWCEIGGVEPALARRALLEQMKEQPWWNNFPISAEELRI